VADMNEPAPRPAESQLNRDILSVMEGASKGYFLLLACAALTFACGAGAFLYQVRYGMGVAGYSHPVYWGAYIVTFVFWVGIGHAGTLISAILYLFRAKWRNAINRAAEGMTIFAVMTAGLFPLIHIGRVFKFYWLLPYPNQRALWVNFKSPLLWDVFAVNTYMLISIIFFFIGLVPDFAIARDRSTGIRKLVYTVLSLGWQGTGRQWKAHNRAVLHLSGLATPLVLSVHSVVSWDFAMSLVPGWHATIFAPYFVAGAILSGFAMVCTLMIPIRRIYQLEHIITEYHFENMTRFLLLTSTIVVYAYGIEYFVAWYSGVEAEQTSFWERAFGSYWVATWIMIIANGVVPQLFWFKKLRTNVPVIFIISFIINIGMWFERYVIIATGLSREFDPAVWGQYTPTWVELAIMCGSFGFFSTLFILLIKAVPIIAIAEMKELAIHERTHGGAH
jgi:Ni/Fe-hydrogenase subunit HybB-like protein